MSRKNEQLIEYCYLKNILTHENDMKSVLWGRFKSFIQENSKPIIVSLAEEAWHVVFWSPPHHSNLQSIYLVWENVKGTIGWQSLTNANFAYDHNFNIWKCFWPWHIQRKIITKHTHFQRNNGVYVCILNVIFIILLGSNTYPEEPA